MFRLIVNLIFIVIILVFVIINIPYKTTINFFGQKYENISVISIVLFSIIAGIVISFFYYVTSYFDKLRKEKIKEKINKSKQKEKELKEKEKNIEKVVEQKLNEAGEKEVKVKGLKRFFRKKKK